MRYRTIGRTGVAVSQLGFGCMRLPLKDENASHIDYDKATQLVHYAIDHGVNFVDTAYFYHCETFGKGESEPFVGDALSGGWRERVNLATKMPLHFLQTADEMPRFLDEQLARLRTGHLDFYLLHALTGETFDRVVALGVLEFLDKVRAEGLVRFPAFSFHGTVADFKRIIDSYDWAFAQIQFNYMDIAYQAGVEGLHYAAEKGVGVAIMEPLKGGKLADKAPTLVTDVFNAATVGTGRTAAEWALRYVWNEPGVSVLLSGMNSMEQVVENVRVAGDASPSSLSEAELAVYADARRVMSGRIKADCTACRYCQPCPSGVSIPEVFAALNAATMWDDPNQWMAGYTLVKGKAALCTACGQCEEVCPEALPIPSLMKDAIATFGG